MGQLGDNKGSRLQVIRFFSSFQTRAFFIAVLGLTPPQLLSDQLSDNPTTGVQWLLGMRKAATTLNYHGVVAYIKDQQIDSFKLYHQVVDGRERERLVAMNSPFREVLRADGNVARYTADTHQVVVETKPSNQSVLINLPEDASQLDRYYQINLRGQEYVAGALTQVVALEPRDAYRYSRLLWIDTTTHLPLKLEVLNEDGMSVEQMVFTTINTKDPIPPQDLQPSVQAASAITQISHRETLPVDGLKWTFASVPDGFQLVSYSILKRPPLNSPVEHILMSDGFTSVSVYIEKRDSRIKPGARKIGAAAVESVKLGDFEVTVMGEVPQKTVELIANGVRKKGDN